MKELKTDSGLKTLAIYNVAFVVSDIDKAADWYADTLGFNLLGRETIPGDKESLEMVFMEGAGVKLEILQNSENKYIETIEKDSRADAPPKVIGSKAIVFQVEDLDVATLELEEKEVDFLWKKRYLAGDKLYCTMILDPDGNRINIFQSNTVA